MSDALTVTRIETLEELTDALEIRRRVFIDEQNVPENEEIDRFDDDPTTVDDCVHMLVRLGTEPVGTGRLLLDDPAEERAHIGRVAVLLEHRKMGAGRHVMEALQDEARRLGRPGITLSAQLQAMPFYLRLGYRARGNVFLDAGIEHRWMDLDFG